MSYIVTTKRRNECGQSPASCKWGEACADCADGLSRQTVATLDEARKLAADVEAEGFEWQGESFVPASYLIPESGGTVGPLPDGTVITVRAA